MSPSSAPSVSSLGGTSRCPALRERRVLIVAVVVSDDDHDTEARKL